DGDKIRLLPYAFDISSRRLERRAVAAADDTELKLVLIGTKLDGKGQEEALAALAILQETGVPAHLRLVGPGRPEYVRRLKRRATEIGIGGIAEIINEVPD